MDEVLSICADAVATVIFGVTIVAVTLTLLETTVRLMSAALTPGSCAASCKAKALASKEETSPESTKEVLMTGR